MTRSTNIVSVAFLLVLAGSTQVWAQKVESNLVRHEAAFPNVGGGVALTMHRRAKDNGWAVRLTNKRGKTVALTSLPEWAGASYYSVVSVADRIGEAWVIILEARPNPKLRAPADSATFQAAFAYGRSPLSNRKIWKVIATTSRSELDGGEQLVVSQERGDTPALHRISTKDSVFCGGAASYQIFVPGKLSFRSALDVDLLVEGAQTAAVALPKNRFKEPVIRSYYLWQSATSDRRNPDDSSTVIRPLALGDRDLATAWAEGDAGDGDGQFVTARINPALKMKGVRIFPGHGGHDEFQAFRRPKRLLFSLSDGTRYLADLPDTPLRTLADRGGLMVKFPQPVTTSCLSVVILGTRPGHKHDLGKDAWKARSAAISEITPLSELYGLAPEDASIVLVEMLLKQETSADARRLATLASPFGDDLVRVLRDVVDQGSEADRARIAPLLRYLPAKQSVPVLMRLFERVDPKDASYMAIKRSLVMHREEASKQLVQLLYENPPKSERKRLDLVRLVGRLGGPDDIRPLIQDFGKGQAQLRNERIRAVTRGGEALLQDLFGALETETDDSLAQEDTLRTIASLGRKLFQIAQGQIDGSRALIGAAHGAKTERIRMLSVRCLGYFQTAGGVDLLSDYAQSQRSPLTRSLATRSLARYQGEAARKVIEGRLNDPSPDVRIHAAEGLGQRSDRADSLAALLTYVSKERWPSGLEAGFEALAQSGDAETLKRLEGLTLSSPYDKRSEVAIAAVERAERAFSPGTLKRLVNDPKVSFMTKRHVIDMLGIEPSEPAEVLLLDIIGSPNRFPTLDERRNATLRGRAILALGRQRTPQARDALLYVLHDEKEAKIQKLALRALAFYSDESIIAELRLIKETAPDGLRQSYEDAISMISRRSGIRNLGDTLDEVDERMNARDEEPTSD